MSRFDLLKSLIRAGADRARDGLDAVGPVNALKRAVGELRKQRMVVPEQMLGSAIAHAPGVLAANATARHGRIQLDARFDDGELACALEFFGARFAPRGAKELTFRVHPAGGARDPRIRELTGAIAGVIARGLWPMVIDSRASIYGAIVDRDGDDLVRVDLRSVPAVRDAVGSGAKGLVLEALELSRIDCEDGELLLHLRLPGLNF